VTRQWRIKELEFTRARAESFCIRDFIDNPEEFLVVYKGTLAFEDHSGEPVGGFDERSPLL
jgi:hypothetical protein